MKLWHLAPLALLLSQGTAFAKNYGMAGCGLGSLVVKTDDKVQILAATLNATGGNQTFGITSGTSNCLPADKAAALEQQQHYVRSNLENLRRDMVKGDGEYLKGYAEVLGCNAQSYGAFKSVAKSDEAQIFRAPGAIAVLEATKTSLRKSTELQNACSNLI
ncbi:MAG: DUF3015 domain-containing protein [Proteobacteria bacterium]|nr:MAG: DUF3015 domain-containing protein [Pseudomonadota bacterium]